MEFLELYDLTCFRPSSPSLRVRLIPHREPVNQSWSGAGALEHSIYIHQLGKQRTLISTHYYLVLVKRVLRVARVPERVKGFSLSSSFLTRKKRNISRQPAYMLHLFCPAQSFKNITRSFEHSPVLSQALY